VGHLQTVSSVSFSSSGVFLASGSLDRTVRVWNLQEGVVAARLQQDSDDGSVRCVAFSPDGDRVVAGCGDRAVKVWNFRTGDQEEQLCGHEEEIRGVCVTLRGDRAVSCSPDMTARVWRLPPKRAVAAAAPVVPAPCCNTSFTLAAPGGAAPSAIPPVMEVRPGNSSTMASFKDLHERLRHTEDTNQQLRKHLSEAEQRRQLERTGEQATQERQLNDYREMINTLTTEKEKLTRSYEEMRREFQQGPTSPAGGSRSPLQHHHIAAGALGAAGGSPQCFGGASESCGGGRLGVAGGGASSQAEVGLPASLAAALHVQQAAGSPSPNKSGGLPLADAVAKLGGSRGHPPSRQQGGRPSQQARPEARSGYPLGATISTAPGAAGSRPRRSYLN